LAEPRYVVGIDLGTTNSVVAYTDARVEPGTQPDIRVFAIPQLVAPGSVSAEPALPSFVLLPGPHDVAGGGLDLPWKTGADRAVGAFARDRGAELPHRAVSSAKSWLANSRVDRRDKILPWNAEEPPQGKLSPVEASAEVLEHIRAAWNHEMGPGARLEDQEILLTVPASFDALSRELTVEAARMAGLPNVTLLEEPQAAFYAWIWQSRDRWRKEVHTGDLVLVCDLGGGTCDFSLIRVGEQDGDLSLERVAVGDHLLVGGDNMDLSLAHSVAHKLSTEGRKLDAWQMRGLWQACRTAKEKLLAEDPPETWPVAVLGRGGGLIAGTVKTELLAEEIQEQLTDAFFPYCRREDKPGHGHRLGMMELGLVYESDPAITRHAGAFLTRANAGFPSAVLFNGGVMKAAALRKRMIAVLNSWKQEGDVRELAGAQYDQAVAIGAAFYGLARRGLAVRIQSGLNRTYYIGVEAAMPAVPGMPAPVRALCVAPFGMEEGATLSLPQAKFGLLTGEPVRFELLASTKRRDDAPGSMVDEWEDEISPVSIMETELSGEPGQVVPVTLEVKVTEVGTMEIWCVSEQADERWKLEFSVRERE